MVVVKPFRGVRFNRDRVADLQAVVSQPYDRIGPDLATRYRQLSPYNITGIILGHNEDTGLPGPCEGEDGSDYRCAQERYARWLAGGILIREEHPALYACEQTFPLAGRTHARLGLIAALRLHGRFLDTRRGARNHISIFAASAERQPPVVDGREIIEASWHPIDALPANIAAATRARIIEIRDGQPPAAEWLP